jgi:hypothetical protein
MSEWKGSVEKRGNNSTGVEKTPGISQRAETIAVLRAEVEALQAENRMLKKELASRPPKELPGPHECRTRAGVAPHDSVSMATEPPRQPRRGRPKSDLTAAERQKMYRERMKA